jgi:hypothetical protein
MSLGEHKNIFDNTRKSHTPAELQRGMEIVMVIGG